MSVLKSQHLILRKTDSYKILRYDRYRDGRAVRIDAEYCRAINIFARLDHFPALRHGR